MDNKSRSKHLFFKRKKRKEEKEEKRKEKKIIIYKGLQSPSPVFLFVCFITGLQGFHPFYFILSTYSGMGVALFRFAWTGDSWRQWREPVYQPYVFFTTEIPRQCSHQTELSGGEKREDPPPLPPPPHTHTHKHHHHQTNKQTVDGADYQFLYAQSFTGSPPPPQPPPFFPPREPRRGYYAILSPMCLVVEIYSNKGKNA